MSNNDKFYRVLAIIAVVAIVAIAVVVVGPKFGLNVEPKEVHPAVQQFLDDPEYDGSKVELVSEAWVRDSCPDLYEATLDGNGTRPIGVYVSYKNTVYFMRLLESNLYGIEWFAEKGSNTLAVRVGDTVQPPIQAERMSKELWGITE